MRTNLAVLICAGTMLASSAGVGLAQSNQGGGTGSTGNESNNPAVIQKDSMGKMDNMKMNTDGSKPGKDCGVKGENQGTANPATQKGCE